MAANVIPNIYPSPSDFDNLSRVRTETKDSNNPGVDYTGIVVNKPWGYEYLWYQNEHVAVWFLHLREGASTSLHCHVRKKTSLIVLDGQVVCSTLDDRYSFSVLGSIVLQPCVFHSTRAISPGGAFIIEVETPPLKSDLVRLKDSFGRQGAGYEGASEHSSELSKYEYHKFGEAGVFRGVTYELRHIEPQLPAAGIFNDCELVVSFGGSLYSQSGPTLQTGEVTRAESLRKSKTTQPLEALDLLMLRCQ